MTDEKQSAAPMVEREELIELMSGFRLSNWVDDMGDGLPLVDRITSGGDIGEGLAQLELLADEIESLFADRALLASPSLPAGQTLSAQPVATIVEMSDEQIKAALPPMSAFLRQSLYDYEQREVVAHVIQCVRAILAASRLDGANAAHSKSEYKRRVAMGDTNIQPPGEKP